MKLLGYLVQTSASHQRWWMRLGSFSSTMGLSQIIHDAPHLGEASRGHWVIFWCLIKFFRWKIAVLLLKKITCLWWILTFLWREEWNFHLWWIESQFFIGQIILLVKWMNAKTWDPQNAYFWVRIDSKRYQIVGCPSSLDNCADAMHRLVNLWSLKRDRTLTASKWILLVLQHATPFLW